MNYSIIWIDDEWQKIADFIADAEQEKIDITPFSSHEEGIAELLKKPHLYDAVILDAKVKKKKDDEATGLEGLIASIKKLESIKGISYIPYFIYTGEPDYANSQIFRETYGDYYIKPQDKERLFSDIKKSLLEKKETRLKERFDYAFEAISSKYLPNDYSNELMQLLLTLDQSNLVDSRKYFSHVRLLTEAVFKSAYEYGLVHELCAEKGKINLFEASNFLAGKPVYRKKVQCKKAHFPGIMAEYVKNILNFCGAANHTDNEENFNIARFSEYEEQVKSNNLLNSIIFQLLDLLKWYKDYLQDNRCLNKNKELWQSLDEDVNNPREKWIEGEVSQIAGNGYANFLYENRTKWLLIPPKIVFKNNLIEGDKVEITITYKPYIDQIRKLS